MRRVCVCVRACVRVPLHRLTSVQMIHLSHINKSHFIYKLCNKSELIYDEKGEWSGTALDLKDGYIHLSTKEEIEKSANVSNPS